MTPSGSLNPATSLLLEELRAAGVVDERVLAVMAQIPRDQFVPATFAHHAWDNVALPIGSGQTISQPLIVARMTEALELRLANKVLEIGTGSGYQTAILAKLCRRVFTIERHQTLWREAHKRLAALRLGNVTTRYGDGTKAWPEPGPFDRIIITAAATDIPPAIFDALASDGIIVAPLGQEWREQVLTRIRRQGQSFIFEKLCPVRFVPLVSGLPRNGALTNFAIAVEKAASKLAIQ